MRRKSEQSKALIPGYVWGDTETILRAKGLNNLANLMYSKPFSPQNGLFDIPADTPAAARNLEYLTPRFSGNMKELGKISQGLVDVIVRMNCDQPLGTPVSQKQIAETLTLNNEKTGGDLEIMQSDIAGPFRRLVQLGVLV